MSELRRDPILDTWVIIAAERGRRPSDFAAVSEQLTVPSGCPFCAGNEAKTPPEIFAIRGDTPANGPGWEVRVVPNKYPALQIDGDVERAGLGLLDRMNGVGAHEVIIETPDHLMDMAVASPEHIARVFDAFDQRTCDLRGDQRFRHIIIFRNYGAVAGASLSHPHSQLIALPIIPSIVVAKLEAARQHYADKERCIFCDMVAQELTLPERVILRNEHFAVLSPYAARFPYEVEIYPLRHSHDFILMSAEERLALGETLRFILQRYREALGDPPYNMMLHTSPSPLPRAGHPEYWGTLAYDYHWHIELMPRLTKTAGFEWGTGFWINPVAPEDAARVLREGSDATGYNE